MAVEFVKVTQAFFDRSKLDKKLAAGRKRLLSKQGAYVRQRARTSIRRRKKSSPPGQPPSAHGDAIKLILFAYDPKTESVVVGPVRFFRSRQSPPGEATRLLEFGGDTTRRGPGGKSRRLHYRGNPFMGPAEEAERPKFAPLAKGILH